MTETTNKLPKEIAEKMMVWERIPFFQLEEGMALSDLMNKYGHYNPEFESETWGYDGGQEFFLRYQRPENDAEHQRRIDAYVKERDRAKKENDKKIAKERKEYERLKKKFEKKDVKKKA